MPKPSRSASRRPAEASGRLAPGCLAGGRAGALRAGNRPAPGTAGDGSPAAPSQGGDLHLPFRRALAARQLRPQTRGPGGNPWGISAHRDAHAWHPGLRAPASLGPAQSSLGLGAFAGPFVERPFGRPLDDALGTFGAARGLRPHARRGDGLAGDRGGCGRPLPAAQQPAAGGRLAGKDCAQYWTRAPWPVWRRFGDAQGPLVPGSLRF